MYGSRARGSARNDSAWDILVLVNKPEVTTKDEQLFRHKLFDLELETGQAISIFAYAMKDRKTRMSVTPLYKNAQREGIYL